MWNTQPIQQAIATATSSNLIFIVHIYDEDSSEWANAILNDEVSSIIQKTSVSIRLNANSSDAVMFGQLFPITSVPCLYFIKSGIVRSLLFSEATSKDVIQSITKSNEILTTPSITNETIQNLNQSSTTDSSSTMDSMSNASSSPLNSQFIPNLLSNSAPHPDLSLTELPTIPHSSAQSLAPGSSSSSISISSTSQQSTSPNSSSSTTSQSQLETVRQQLAHQRKIKEQDQKKAEKKREVERRNQLKAQQQIKRTKEEIEQLKYAEELKKSRKADKEAEKKILAEIAKDKAERQARQAEELAQRTSGSSNATLSSASLPRIGSKVSMSTSSLSKSSKSCSLVIRLLNGSIMKHTFSAEDTLDNVRNYIDANRTDGDHPFFLITTFPTHEFSINEEQKTLKSLGLCPSSTLICKPTKSPAIAYEEPQGLATSVVSSGWSFIKGGAGMAVSAADKVFKYVAGQVPTIEAERGRPAKSDTSHSFSSRHSLSSPSVKPGESPHKHKSVEQE